MKSCFVIWANLIVATIGSQITSAATYTDVMGNVSKYYSVYGYTDTAMTQPMNNGNGDPLDPGSPAVRQSTTLNGAVFTVDETGSGTGTFASFLRIQGANQERGMNADSITSKVRNNEKSDNNSNHDLPLSQIPLNTLEAGEFGVSRKERYLEIRMDMNENQNASIPEWSIITELQLWVSPGPISTPYIYNNGVDPIGHPDETSTSSTTHSASGASGDAYEGAFRGSVQTHSKKAIC